jgi:hypothetical protein
MLAALVLGIGAWNMAEREQGADRRVALKDNE